MIKYVFLDLDDTILDFHAAEIVAIKDTLKRIFGYADDDLTKRYQVINKECWEKLERGEMSRDEVLVRRFDLLFAEYGITASSEETQALYSALLGKQHPFMEGAEMLLEEFQRIGRYQLYIASNGIHSVQKPRIEDSGIGKYFADIFISELIGANKPSPAFFEACFAKIDGFCHKECIIVGDSLTSDIQGGKNAGISTCWFNPHGLTQNTILPDYEIKNLSELIPLLDSIK